MQYVMFVRVDPALSAIEPGEDVEPWVEAGDSSGMRVQGDALESVATATCVRVRDGETLISDGPFTETKEIVAGYDLLEAPDLQSAIDFAAQHPCAATGAIEVREVWAGFAGVHTGPAPDVRPDDVGYMLIHVPDADLIRTASRETGDPSPWVARAEAGRARVGGWRLRDADADNAATVRRRQGETLITAGPYTETVEQIAGLDILRTADLDEALELAAAHPTARFGVIEVRPFMVW